jgi:hypothetical protein
MIAYDYSRPARLRIKSAMPIQANQGVGLPGLKRLAGTLRLPSRLSRRPHPGRRLNEKFVRN